MRDRGVTVPGGAEERLRPVPAAPRVGPRAVGRAVRLFVRKTHRAPSRRPVYARTLLFIWIEKKTAAKNVLVKS